MIMALRPLTKQRQQWLQLNVLVAPCHKVSRLRTCVKASGLKLLVKANNTIPNYTKLDILLNLLYIPTLHSTLVIYVKFRENLRQLGWLN